MKKIILLLAILISFSAQGQSNYWSKVNSGTTNRLMSISFGSPSVGYISGADSLLLKTTDGGKTWHPHSHFGMAFSLASPDIIHVNFVNSTTGFAIVSSYQDPTYQGAMYKTVDGGSTWAPVVSGNIAAYSTFFFDENNGYQVGSAFFSGQTLMKVSNGVWGNYHYFSFSADEFLYTVDVYDAFVGIAGGTGGIVYRTFDGGVTWDTVKTVVDSNINALKFLDHRTIVGACNDPMGGLIISTDTGRTWQKETNSLSFFYPYFKSLALSKKDSIIAVGRASGNNSGVILAWRNGFWNADGADQPLRSVAMSNDSVAFAVGDSGLIVSNLHHLVSVAGPEKDEPFVQIYPNPSDGSFITRMQVHHTIKVFDAIGRLVYRVDSPSLDHHIRLTDKVSGMYTILLMPVNGEVIAREVLVN